MVESYLVHHGILGQKWGIRRYQNPDGTLTDAGKKHYAKGITKELNDTVKRGNSTYSMKFKKKELNNYLEKEAYKLAEKYIKNSEANMYEDSKEFVKEILGEYADKNIKGWNGHTETAKEWLNDYFYSKTAEYYSKLKVTPEEAELAKKNTELINKIVDDDDIIDGKWSKYDYDTKFREKWEKNAELGLKALKIAGDTDVEPYDDGWKEWFLFEDQTIGMGFISSLVNKGINKEEIKTMIKDTYRSNSSAYDTDNNKKLDHAIFEINEGNWNGRLEKFVDECYEVKEKEIN